MSDKLMEELVAALRGVLAREVPVVVRNNPVLSNAAHVLAKVDAYYGPEYPAKKASLAALAGMGMAAS